MESALPPRRVVTDRLEVRCYEPADAPTLRRVIQENRDHLASFMPWAREDKTVGAQLDWVLKTRAEFDTGENFIYGVFAREDGALVGGSGLHTRCGPGGFEIGYWIDRRRLRRGLATETTAVLTRVGIELCGARRIEIRVARDNAVSARIPEKLGFTREGLLLRRLPHPDQWLDLVSWCLPAEALPGSPAAGYAYEAFDALGRAQV